MTQTSIFKDSRITPEAGRQVVLNMMTGQIVSPAVYDPKRKILLCPGGSARPYMIKSWAYLGAINSGNVSGQEAVLRSSRVKFAA